MEFNRHSGNYVDRSFSSFDRQGKKTIIVDGCSMAGEFLDSISDTQDKKERDRYEGGDIGINLSERFGFNPFGDPFERKREEERWGFERPRGGRRNRYR